MSHLDELLSVYLDGESTPAESQRVRLHLGECLRCRQRLERLHEARAAVRSLPHLDMPPELMPAPASPGRSHRRPLWVGAAAAVVAAVVVATAAVRGPRPEPLDLSDLSRQIGARAALDSGAGSIKVVMPGVVRE